ncbi:MAG: ABC transporter ATP-binding protein [Bradyrhizobiaceae bacterium]|nr:ABC transporter ATP-binding protein [Bradyrhizobiaceae bacterium]
MAILEVKGLCKNFGSLVAASDINISVDDHEVVGIIGANGAGKTTFVNLVTGYLKPTRGTISFDGRNITSLPPRAVINAGISRSFQVPQVFGSATIFDNVLIALGIAHDGKFPIWRPLRRAALIAATDQILERFGIAANRDYVANQVSQGVRKLMDIAMATVHRPRLLLLDEPTSGVSVEQKFEIMDVIMGALRNEKITVLFVEHDMDIIARYATRVVAFYDGTIIADGLPQQVIDDPQVRRYIIGEQLRLKVEA